jgi:hypothetical protein
MPFVPLHIPVYFGVPIGRVAFGTPLAAAFLTIMSVPKAPVNEYGRLPSWQHNVWIAWQVFPMQPEPIAHSVKHAAYGDLGLCIFACDPPHDL